MFLLWSRGLVRVVSYETPACTLAGRPGAACVAAFMLLRSRQTAGSTARELLSSPVCKWGNGQPGVTGSGGGRASVAGLAAAGTPLSSGVPRRPGQRAHCRGSASAAACRVGCCSLQTETCSHPSQCPTSLLLGQDLSSLAVHKDVSSGLGQRAAYENHPRSHAPADGVGLGTVPWGHRCIHLRQAPAPQSLRCRPVPCPHRTLQRSESIFVLSRWDMMSPWFDLDLSRPFRAASASPASRGNEGVLSTSGQ